jgi:hypothetical protein
MPEGSIHRRTVALRAKRGVKGVRNMKFLVVVAAVGIIFAYGCGGSGGGEDDDTLTLRNMDVTAEEYRSGIRKLFLSEPGSGAFCQNLQGLAPQEVIDVLAETGEPPETPSPYFEATFSPGQEPDEGDSLIAAGIILEECARIAER